MSDSAINSAVCRRIPLTVNSRTLKFIYPDRPSETIWNREDLPQICFGETVIFCFTFLDEANQEISFLENDSFTLAADADFIHGEDPLMLFAGPECVNLPGDWDDADPLHGKISIRVNCNTVGFEQKIGSAEDLIVRMEVRRISGNFQTVLLHANAIARNTILLNEYAPDMAVPEYYTAAQTEQLFAGFSNENEAAHNALEDKIKSVAGSVAEIQLTADSASANSAAAQSTADTALSNAATAQSTADTALANTATAQSTADTALANAATAQNTADTALANAAAAQTAANSKLSAPVAAGTAGQILTLDTDGVTPVWANPTGGSGGGGGLTKWGTWQNISAATEYTAETNGWLRVSSLSPGDVSVIIDGVTVFQASHQDDSGTTFMKIGMIIPVFTGQVYSIEGAIDPQFAPCV